MCIYRRSGNFRVAFFHIRNVRMFNLRRVAKWRKLYAHVRNFRAFHFRCLSNWQKNLTAKISQCTVVTGTLSSDQMHDFVTVV